MPSAKLSIIRRLMVRDQEAGGSNPLAPTISFSSLEVPVILNPVMSTWKFQVRLRVGLRLLPSVPTIGPVQNLPANFPSSSAHLREDKSPDIPADTISLAPKSQVEFKPALPKAGRIWLSVIMFWKLWSYRKMLAD